MRWVIAFVVAMTSAAGMALGEEVDDRQLRGEVLHKAVAGKTVSLETPMGSLPIKFRVDGTMSGRAGELASYTGSAEDRGRWWVAAEKLCQRWQTWLGGKTYCFTLRQKGPTVHWVRNDGMSGSATIARR